MKTGLKWLRRILGGLVALLIVVAIVAYLVGGSKLSQTYNTPDVALVVSDDSAHVARGEYLAAARGCTDCHAENLGGQVMFDAPPFRVVASNLTNGGILADRSDAQLERAIRHGIRGDGTAMLIMPSKAFHGMSDQDVGALVSYLRSVPEIENDLGETKVKVLGRMLAAGPLDTSFEVELATSPTSHPEVAPTVEYGRYVMGSFCSYCHGANGEGVEVLPMPDAPPGPPLDAAANWTLEEFKESLASGTTPDGRELNQEFMPIEATRHLSDVEVEALYTFMGSQ